MRSPGGVCSIGQGLTWGAYLGDSILVKSTDGKVRSMTKRRPMKAGRSLPYRRRFNRGLMSGKDKASAQGLMT